MNVSVTCDYCGNKFERSKRRYNEAIKYSWKQFCSSKCQSEAKTTNQKCVCANPLCRKEFTRQRKEFNKSALHFCSQSCCATYSNAIRCSAAILRKCLRASCKRHVHLDKRSKYCSRECADAGRHGQTKYSPQQVIDEIKLFFDKNKRLPIRNELGRLNRLARRFFGTWNRAIIAAGFEPNPVLFSKKFVANDGHPCDSLSEKIVDDWFFTRKIPHEIKVKYPWNNGMSADFKVGDHWIELFGLTGQLKTYDRLMKEKLQKIKKYNLKLISLYLSDLFPKNHLEEKLGVLQR